MSANDRNLGRSALVVSILFLIGGLYIFLKDISFMEKGHGILILLYILFCGAFYLFFKAWKIGFTALSVLLLVFCLTFIVQKYEWRKDYVNSATPFFLEEYITEYPSFEEYLKISYFGGENWVGFSKDCAEPAILGRTTPSSCNSFAAVQEFYGLDLKQAVNSYYGRMKSTAKKVNDRKLTTDKQYKSCIENKSCAPIPMLPKGVAADSIDENSTAYMDIRTAYWDLMEQKTITANVCPYMKLCNVMEKLGIVNLEKFNM